MMNISKSEPCYRIVEKEFYAPNPDRLRLMRTGNEQWPIPFSERTQIDLRLLYERNAKSARAQGNMVMYDRQGKYSIIQTGWIILVPQKFFPSGKCSTLEIVLSSSERVIETILFNVDKKGKTLLLLVSNGEQFNLGYNHNGKIMPKNKMP